MAKRYNIIHTKGKYQTIDEMAQHDFFTPMGSSAYTDCEEAYALRPYNGFEALRDWPGLRQKTIETLGEMGIHRMSYLGNGDFAMVFKTTDDQVVRISVDTQENKRPVHPAILQPHLSMLITDEDTPDSPVLRLEVLEHVKDKNGRPKPEIVTQGVTREHVDKLKEALSKSNLDPHDVKHQNIALLSDGTPVVIDGGAVDAIEGKEMVLDENVLQDWLSVDKNGKTTWKQYALHPSIIRGEVTGTIRPKDLVNLKSVVGEHSQIYKAALEDGLYRAELGQIIVDAGKAHEIAEKEAQKRGETISFSDTLKQVRKQYNKRSGPEEDWPKYR